ncbi:MAG: hypothetical protein LBI33_08555 [Propionibacteriaceae bacterium]|nr:hypothetical protein [Propionibacteriaceae bacterium]
MSPDVAQSVPFVAMGTEIVADAGGAEVRVSADYAADVVLSAADSSWDGTGLLGPVAISLPKEIRGKHGQAVNNGSIVYLDSSAQGTDVVVQATSDDAVKIHTVTKSNGSGKKYTYSFGDATPVLGADGSVILTRSVSGSGVTGRVIVATIAPAWAVDANGNPVSTHYEVSKKGELTQIISPGKNAVYPIVADPKVVTSRDSVGHVVWDIYFSKSETSKISAGATIAAAVFALSSLIPLPPWPAIAQALAGVAGTYAGIAAYYLASNACLNVTATLASYAVVSTLIPWAYRGGYCV